LKSAVGLDQKRQPTLINFGNTVTPHMMIAGTTGSGKTNAEQLLVRNLAFYNAPD
jgi:DNA segregation ATPase FtsK/SpoIIIE-like protein